MCGPVHDAVRVGIDRDPVFVTNHGFRVSRLTLGTAQLGMAYGIANRRGQPDADGAEAILDRAWACGMTCFDTARAYGDAEPRLGAWLDKTGVEAEIISKFPALADDQSAAEQVRRHFGESCAALGRERIDAYLAHRAADLDRPGVVDVLQELRDTGRIHAFGASVYTAEQAMSALQVPGLGAIQGPLSIFNWSLVDSGALAACAEAGIAVFARSVFVQGLIFVEPAALPNHLAAAGDIIGAYRALAADHGLSPGALALGAVLSRPEVASVVIGAETPDQVSGLAAMADTEVDQAIVEQAITLARGHPAALFDPSRWPAD